MYHIIFGSGMAIWGVIQMVWGNELSAVAGAVWVVGGILMIQFG